MIGRATVFGFFRPAQRAHFAGRTRSRAMVDRCTRRPHKPPERRASWVKFGVLLLS